MTTFRLGINTCFAVKRWPRPEDWAAVVRDDLGLDLVQHSLDLADLGGPRSWTKEQAVELGQACTAFALSLHSTFTGLAAYSSNLLLHPDERARRYAEDWYRLAIDFTAAAGAPATGGHIGAYSVTDWADPVRRADLATELHGTLTRLSWYARGAGLDTIYVENLAARREPSTMEGMQALVRPGDQSHAAVALCLDVGHQCVPGTTGADRDPYAWLERFGATAALVQLQQSDDVADHHWPFTVGCNRTGRIVADRVLESLAASGANSVDLVLEIIPAFEADDATVLADLVASADHWRRALAG